MIIYNLDSKGKAINVTLKRTTYVLEEGEKSIETDIIPDSETLNTDEYNDNVQIEAQKQTCVQLLRDIDHKFLPNYRHPDDVPQWQIYQDQVISILESSEVQEIPEKLTF